MASFTSQLKDDLPGLLKIVPAYAYLYQKFRLVYSIEEELTGCRVDIMKEIFEISNL